MTAARHSNLERCLRALAELGSVGTAVEIATVTQLAPKQVGAVLRRSSGRARVVGRQVPTYAWARRAGLAQWVLSSTIGDAGVVLVGDDVVRAVGVA